MMTPEVRRALAELEADARAVSALYLVALDVLATHPHAATTPMRGIDATSPQDRATADVWRYTRLVEVKALRLARELRAARRTLADALKACDAPV